MYLYLNINDIIIDIVEDVKPVRRNVNNIIIPCYPDKAQGYMGTDEKIYAKMGENFIPQFDDIKTFIGVDEIPEYVVPRAWKYQDGEFIMAENYELSISQLTDSSEQQRADIDFIAMETGVEL